MSETIAIIFFILGLIFNLLGCIGLVRMPDIYNRLQAATKCVTLGTCAFIAGGIIFSLLQKNYDFVMQAIMCVFFILLTSPTAAHALSRGAHASGVKLWEKSICDKFREDGGPGIGKKEKQ